MSFERIKEKLVWVCGGAASVESPSTLAHYLRALAERLDEMPEPKNDYKCPYCGETTQRGTFHASCYAAQ